MMPVMKLPLSILLTLFTTVFCIYLLRPFALRIGLVDRPGGRKQHPENIPLVGGIAMFFGFCFGLLTLHFPMHPYRGLLGGGALLVLMGILDDHRDLNSALRLCGQTLTAFLMMIWGGHVLNLWGDLFFLGDIDVGLWGIPITLIVVVGYINALNMLDGQDGLAGGVVLVQLALLVYSFYSLGAYNIVGILAVAMAGVLAFLYFNLSLPWRKKAWVFMGDTGSTFLAFLIIWFAVSLSQYDLQRIKPISAVWLISYPVFDLIQVFIYRIHRGKSPLKAGREHMHHILLNMGIRPLWVNLIIWIGSLVLGLVGLGMNALDCSSGMIFVIWLALLLTYVLVCQFCLTRHRQHIGSHG